MDVGTQRRIQGAAWQAGDGKAAPQADLGLSLVALLQYNVLAWEGPLFIDGAGKKIPCTPANVVRMPAGHPFTEKIAEAIAARNKPAESPDPNSNDSPGSTTDGDGDLTTLSEPEKASSQ